ncbi:MAG: TonB family protein [Candidatus Omnitrophica bacterium]|nr:TonB family protein [Candidatus Omnitrophota bacterium]
MNRSRLTFRVLFCAVTSLFFFFGGTIPVLEGGSDTMDWLREEPGTVWIVKGDTKMFPTNAPTKVMISNPRVADVAGVTDSMIAVTANLDGKTTLTYFDADGEQTIEIRVIPEDIEELKKRVDRLLETLNLPGVYTEALPAEGKVALLGKVNKGQEGERITVVLGDLNSKVIDLTIDKEQQTVIEIDVQVLEVDKGSTKVLGFTWPSGFTLDEVGSPGIASQGDTTITTTGSLVSTETVQSLPGTPWGTLFKVVNMSRQAFQLSVDALMQEGKAKILSRPRLACQSGKSAELFVGGEKPVFSTNIASFSGAQGTSIEYKEYGIKLKVEPTIVGDGRMKLVLDIDVSEIGDAETIGTASTGAVTAKAYPMIKRSASTELYINDGQTLAIGGLIKQKEDESTSKVPFLGDIPILGAIFRRKAVKIGDGAGAKANTELFITLTPTVISEEEDSLWRSGKEYSPSYAQVKTTLPSSAYAREYMMSAIEYSGIVQERILEKLVYPYQAKEAGFEGMVKLGLHISYVGDLLDLKVKVSSGYKTLDDSALKAAKEIEIYPPFPPSLEIKDIWIDIPIIYKAE